VLRESACSISISGWPTKIGKGEVSLVFRAAVCSHVVIFVDRKLLLQTRRRRLHASNKRRRSSTGTLPGRWRLVAELARS